MKKKNSILDYLLKYFFLEVGSILAAIGLEMFFIPNKIIDGGIVGVSILVSHLTRIPLGIYIFILNLPFLIFGYKQIGKTFLFSTLFSVVSLSFWVSIFHPIPGLTKDVLLASVFGGIILGIGIGIIIRYGGSLDGTEIIAIILYKKVGFSVGQIVMFFNLFILSGAGLVFGWEKAMYSLIAYFITFKVIDTVIEGFNESKAAFIISEKGEEIAESIKRSLGRGVTFLEGKGGYNGRDKVVLYSVITRLEISKLKYIIKSIDEHAFVTISDVFDIIRGEHNYEKSIN